jgi:dsDNA-specific endonuclease/ATPase MutS2
MRVLLIICAVLTVALGIVGHQAFKAHERAGVYRQAAEQAKQIADANKIAYEAAIYSKDQLIEDLRKARETSEKAATESLNRERAALERIGRVESTLKEAIANDQQSSDWASVRVPDGVIDGMQHSASVALGGAPR